MTTTADNFIDRLPARKGWQAQAFDSRFQPAAAAPQCGFPHFATDGPA